MSHRDPATRTDADRARENAAMCRRVADEFDAAAQRGEADAESCATWAREYRESAARYDELARKLELGGA